MSLNCLDWSFLLESTTVKAIRQAATSVCSLSETEFDIRFNPDIFSPSVKHSEPAPEKPESSTAQQSKTEDTNEKNEQNNEQEDTKQEIGKLKKYPSLELQIRLNKEACEFLLMYQVPQFVRDITSNR
jgi:hypothetical protein